MTDAVRDLAVRTFQSRYGNMRGVREWWVPGRIEVLGKHVDYGGGRSLLAATNRGFHVFARPRNDDRVELVDGSTGEVFLGTMVPHLPPAPGRWQDYPITVLRRIARDFPGRRTGMDAVFASSLPPASGLSSSSALVIAVFLPLAAFNLLAESAAWSSLFSDPGTLAGYLGAMENGRPFGSRPGDFGVGTEGGSEDHTAILHCGAGALLQCRFLPVREERRVPFPAEWTFAVGSSGVHAAKAGVAVEQYNRLSRELATLLEIWRVNAGGPAESLLDVLESDPGAGDRLRRATAGRPDREALVHRLDQFGEECRDIVPRVADAIAANRPDVLGPLVDRSHQLAVSVLRNQVEETVHLARSARHLGAFAASAFGAGFGGSVWALVPARDGAAFLEAWRQDYQVQCPKAAIRAEFFLTPPGQEAQEV